MANKDNPMPQNNPQQPNAQSPQDVDTAQADNDSQQPSAQPGQVVGPQTDPSPAVTSANGNDQQLPTTDNASDNTQVQAPAPEEQPEPQKPAPGAPESMPNTDTAPNSQMPSAVQQAAPQVQSQQSPPEPEPAATAAAAPQTSDEPTASAPQTHYALIATLGVFIVVAAIVSAYIFLEAR